MQSKPVILSDCDGTITQVDVTDLILAQFAHPSWQDVEQEWVRGSIGSRECLERQMALVETSEEELNALIDSVPVDPDFLKFHRSLARRGIPFYVITDGFDTIVRRVLRRAGVEGPLANGTRLFASALQIEGRRLKTAFPFSTTDCEHDCATCKAAVVRRLGFGGRPVIFIGDGLSDRFAVEEATQVFAKRVLAGYCEEKGIACLPFETFADVDLALAKLKGSAPRTRLGRVERPREALRAVKKARGRRPLNIPT
jgi:2-hydroxy-3-keto-5-methylthiopentenyl-1-phosphate phosphatase